MVLSAVPRETRGQAASTGTDVLAQLYNSAMQAFQGGNWATCISKLEELLKQVPNDPQAQAQMAPAYFTLGAAYYNTPNFPKAIEVFKGFVEKFPTSDKLTEARLSLGQCYVASKQYEEAVKVYAVLEANPATRDQALVAQVQVLRAQNKIDEAIKVLERLLGGDIKTPVQANGAVILVELYARKGLTEKASGVLERLQTKTELIDNLVSLNAVAIKLADEFADKQKFKEAIGAYRLVRSREEVIRFQTEKIASIEKRIEYNIRRAQGNPVLLVKANQENNTLKETATVAKQFLDEFVKLPDYAPSILYRMARCWSDWGKKWEAAVTYQRLLDKYPKATEAEPAMYGIVTELADLGRTSSTQQACGRYLKTYPDTENAGTVGYLSGAVALQAGDFKGAETFFGIMLEKQGNSPYKEEMRFLVGHAKFAQERYEEAARDYELYLKEFPKGKNVEECTYRLAVIKVFTGEYESALGMLTRYADEYPKGFYLPDAKYRIAVCKYAASEFEEVAKDCEAWLLEFPEDQIYGEVCALLGDAYAALNQNAPAAKAYMTSFRRATTDEVLNYSLFEASKQLQKTGDWNTLSDMFVGFVKNKPDHPSVIAAMYWIAKAKARSGQVEEAKQLMVDNLKKYMNEPKREAVEQLVTQLAQLCSKRPRPAVEAAPAPAAPAPAAAVAAVAPAAGTPAAAEPAPAEVAAPEPPPYDPFAELDRLVKPLEKDANATARARLLYARAELASLKKQDAMRDKIMQQIADEFKTEDLSPVLLAMVGDHLLAKKDWDRSVSMFEYMRTNFPKSDYLDVAYVGLGEVAFMSKDYEKALDLFSDALDKMSASMKLKEATIGKAKALMEVGRYQESRKLFEQVSGIREWRGDATAFSLYSLGEIQARQNHMPEAIAYYRRVFVAYQKYLPWVAKSYLRTAECFEQLGQRQDAIDSLRDMVRNEKLATQPEYEVAKKRLAELAGGQG